MPYRLAIALCRLLDEVYTICFYFAIPNLKNFKKSDEKELTSGSRSGKISKQIERGAAEKAATRETLKRKRKNILKKVLKTLDRSGSDVVR